MPKLAASGARLPAQGFSVRQTSVIFWPQDRRYYSFAGECGNGRLGLHVADSDGRLLNLLPVVTKPDDAHLGSGDYVAQPQAKFFGA